ncbi:hypothetical protein E4T43_09438 [Aureobasidium subglaciale]|nr:hypothetical protein E4T43_09438 [Aureobasidium subglaciale]
MSTNFNTTGRQEQPGTSAPTYNRLLDSREPINLAARRRKFTAPRVPFSLETVPLHEPQVYISPEQVDEYLRKQEEFNKALLQRQGKRPSSSRSSSRPQSPMDRAAHWVKDKVVTPVKEFFTGPDATEMIDTQRPQDKGDYISHRIRVMEARSPPRTDDDYGMMSELHPVNQRIPERRSRGRPSVNREVSSRRSESISSPNPFMSHGTPSPRSTFSSRETSQAPQAPQAPCKSHKSNASVSSSVRSAFDNVHSGLNPKAVSATKSLEELYIADVVKTVGELPARTPLFLLFRL